MWKTKNDTSNTKKRPKQLPFWFSLFLLLNGGRPQYWSKSRLSAARILKLDCLFLISKNNTQIKNFITLPKQNVDNVFLNPKTNPALLNSKFLSFFLLWHLKKKTFPLDFFANAFSGFKIKSIKCRYVSKNHFPY